MKYTTHQVSKLTFTTIAFGILLSAVGIPNQAHAAPGDLDLTFSTDGKVMTDFSGNSDTGNAVAVQSDGKIVVAGFTRVGLDLATEDFALARYNADGSLDSTFGTGGKVQTDFFTSRDRINAIAIQADGKIIAAGFTDTFFGLIRYHTNGTIDTSFGVFGDGKVRQPVAGGGSAQVNAVAIQSDGKIVVAGRAGDQVANTLDFAILQFNTDGTLDTSFGTGGGTNVDFFAGNDAVFALVIQSDGKIVAAGSASRGDATSPDFALVRLNPDGSFNTTFGTGGKVTTDFSASLDGIYGLALQTDGKIVAAGFTFIESENDDNFALARYDSDGNLDATFGMGGKVITEFSGTGSTDEAHAVVVQPDGAIVAAGIVQTDSNGFDFAVARYLADGSPDSAFGSGGKVTTTFSATDDFDQALTLQPDGKLIAAGGSVGDFAVARYFTGLAATSSKLLNISTRLNVLTGNNVLIGGFIITGTDPKQVIVRAIGPSLGNFGVPDPLADPTLELHAPDGAVISNDNWKETQQAEIEAAGFAPGNDLESAILATLEPGAYTAIVRGANDGTGVGLVEAYDLAPTAGTLANISTRGFVNTGDDVMIGGFIIGGGDEGDSTVLIRGIGPTLTDFGVPGALKDPTLEFHDGDGNIVAENDDWKDTQQTEIEATGLAPGKDLESAILATLSAGGYTAILRGALDTTGVGLVEVYHLQ